jgi:kynurenine 3-monooxygenase
MDMADDVPSDIRKAVIVGAGPVGCLAAMAMAKMGWMVEVYEGRVDVRQPSSKDAAEQRSINLAISSRGIAALQSIDAAAADRFLQTLIPMRGRMIHDAKGNLDSQLYGRDYDGQVTCINSIDRSILNRDLLGEAEASPNIRILFEHKVQTVDFDKKFIVVQKLDEDQSIHVDFDFCIGADGSYSVIRRQLMRVVRMDFHQEYIPHEYLELKMPAGQDQNNCPVFLLDPTHLHIWPRHSFMLIALPNKDKTFTCTLFAPTVEFDRLDQPEIITTWFKFYFPDALAIIGEEALLKAFERNSRSPLISTKSKPYHYKDRVLRLGDAAHSMVPFYGQGLNCGFEDVRVLMTLLRQEGVESTTAAGRRSVDGRLARVLSRYSESRHEDLVAICDLAMDNYVEMRHSVTTPSYIFKKAVDDILFSLSSRRLASLGPLLSQVPFPSQEPSGWLPLYTMVTFRPDISYSTARRKAARQSRILAGLGAVALGATSLAVIWMAISHRIRSQK